MLPTTSNDSIPPVTSPSSQGGTFSSRNSLFRENSFFPFFIARRYLFSKKSTNAINIISGISAIGVTVATMALVIVLSVFNGFHDLVASLFTSFDPQLEVVPAKGKSVPADDPLLTRMRQLPDVELTMDCVEDEALIIYGDRQAMITVKGVDESFKQLTHIDQILYGEGTFELRAGNLEYGILGIRLAQMLGTGARWNGFLKVYAPNREGQIDMMDPTTGFVADSLISPGVVFSVKQAKYDQRYLITSLPFARNLFGMQGMLTSLEVKVKEGADIKAVQRQMQEIGGEKYRVRDRFEQQEDTFRIMSIEKLLAYVFLTFILVVACFNIIGSLSMLIIDKKNDVVTLRNLGASDKQIRQIFLFEGRLIATIGAVIGLLIGLLLCWLQQEFGLVRLGEADGQFIINAYPVSVHATDVLLILFTVIAVGWLSVWYPVHSLSRRLLE